MIYDLKNTVIAFLIALVLGLGAGFGGAWQIQDWRFGAKETQRVQKQAEADRIKGLADIERERVVIDAQNAAIAAAILARNDAAAARTELGKLRGVADASIKAARVSYQACLDNAAALSDVFQASVGEYQALGEKADGHAGDVKTLSDAWPTK